MRYENVCLEAVAYRLPRQVVASAQIEERLAPLYRRLRLPEGRLELITGIRQRRVWPAGTRPGHESILTGRLALDSAGLAAERIGALIHGSVCRDYLEPATASGVHHGLGLPAECVAYDVSNACLGMLNGVLQVANMIELGQIQAGLVVGTEDSRPLLESTIEKLNGDATLSRDAIKQSVASLTIGSGSAAMLVCHRDISRTGNRLLGAIARANTRHHQLCHSGADEAAVTGMQPLMETDSESLMHEGIATGADTYREFLDHLGWKAGDVDKTCTHQVGLTHRKRMLEALQIDAAIDYTSVEILGNTGSVALPITLAKALESRHVRSGDRLALLGIGSGIHCVMLAMQWQKTATGKTNGAPASGSLATTAG